MNKRVMFCLLGFVLLLPLVFVFFIDMNKSFGYKEIESMLSYTLDGKYIKEKPSKDKYLANKIVCEKGTNIVWDNTNWEVELVNLKSADRCNIDFTKNTLEPGYRVTINTNKEELIDSVSKTTIEGGNVTFSGKNGYVISSVSGCSNGKIEDGKLIVTNVTSNATCNVIISEPTLYAKILFDHKKVNVRTNFDEVVGTETPTTGVIYRTIDDWETEDGSTVYYFAGNVSDNWVKFGKDSKNADLYWRIIRTNEDGGVRLLYAGTSPDTTSGYISTPYANTDFYANTTEAGSMYVGYMYGTTGSLENNRTNEGPSTIKYNVDYWYMEGLNGKKDSNNLVYDSYVSKSAIYCNDRANGEYTAGENGETMAYAAYNRLSTVTGGPKPTYRCGYNTVNYYIPASDPIIPIDPDPGPDPIDPGPLVLRKLSTVKTATTNEKKEIEIGMYANADVADKFSVDTSRGGNGKLDYPVGLMTADEVAYAGGKAGTSNPYAYYYLNSANGSVTGENSWWTMSPSGMGSTMTSHGYPIVSVFVVDGLSNNYLGELVVASVYDSGKARPVLSLKSCVKYSSGNGTASSPYEVSIDSTCASAVN